MLRTGPSEAWTEMTPHKNARRRRCDDPGFTLIELMAVVSIFAILSAISMRTYISYNKASTHRGAARETVALLRNAQIRAVTEASRTECRFPNTTTLEIHRAAGRVRVYRLPPNLAYVVSGLVNGKVHGFTHPGDPAGSNARTNCFFYAKGTATSGLIGVKRLDTGKELYIEVTGLTARVSYCAEPTPASPCPV